MRGARAEEVRSEGTEAEGADPRRPEWGSDLLESSRGDQSVGAEPADTKADK